MANRENPLSHQSNLRSVGRQASGPSRQPLEARMQRMEDLQEHILHYLQKADRTTAPREESYVQTPIRRQEDELGDSASSTHPPPHPRNDNIRFTRPLELPQSREIREEVRRLMNEEFPTIERKQFSGHRRSSDLSPLSDTIRQSPIPVGFKLPNMDSYDGTSDPYEHIDHYRTIMHIQRATDALLCQAFPATLKGQARTWFYSLSPSSVNHFEKLVELFTEQFIANRRILKDSSHLSGIRQNEGEALKEYFQRFSTEARQIPGVDPELLRGVFLGGLRPGPFYSALMRDTVRSYPELVHRVEAQIAADEAINTHRKQFEINSGKRKKTSDDAAPSSQRRKFDSRQNANLPSRPPKHDRQPEKTYTPLNTLRVNILMAIQDRNTLRRPTPLKPNTGNQDQYCEFHKGRGHNTDACFQLKDEIE